VKRWTLPLAAGTNRVSLALRGVRLGRYRIELQAVDQGGRVHDRMARALVVTRAARTRRIARARPVAAPPPAPALVAPPAPAPAPTGDAPDDSDGRVRPEDNRGSRSGDDR
jgi:hypothetical protein